MDDDDIGDLDDSDDGDMVNYEDHRDDVISGEENIETGAGDEGNTQVNGDDDLNGSGVRDMEVASHPRDLSTRSAPFRHCSIRDSTWWATMIAGRKPIPSSSSDRPFLINDAPLTFAAVQAHSFASTSTPTPIRRSS